MEGPETAIRAAVRAGDPEKVAALIARGADVRYREEHGYDALIDAVYATAHEGNGRLLALLDVLIAAGVDLSGITTYGESGLRLLADWGKFDAVRRLLHAGADPGHLRWSPLIEAVALGSLEDVEARIEQGAGLEDRDYWSRTAWHVALLTGDLAKAKLLHRRGANANARGWRGKPPLFYAIESRSAEMVRWLLEIRQDVDGTDDFGQTPLMLTVEHDDLACIEVLLRAGADLARDSLGTALGRATTPAVVKRLLDAGADPKDLLFEARRTVLGMPPEPDVRLLQATAEDFARAAVRRFGTTNPERIEEPFWEGMIRSGVSAYEAKLRFDSDADVDPVWCAQRFGQSLTFLPDGRIVQIGGEHEDSYMSEFCIYNDVLVHAPNGAIAIYGYPEAVFPPTDFHTATLIGDQIYVIGSLGYQGTRRPDTTPVHRLDLGTLRMERLETSGENPGWIYGHRAKAAELGEIHVSGGKVMTRDSGTERHDENPATFALDLRRLQWRRLL